MAWNVIEAMTMDDNGIAMEARRNVWAGEIVSRWTAKAEGSALLPKHSVRRLSVLHGGKERIQILPTY